ncbi:MAG: acetylglutamate kinase [Deltaproteobacteria bacterium CG2_30_63_29]|nr:MAG: acetylglutamate kinase [Deltaproteobacteria bacterium CG2_30_63_29]PJB48827.1 MAG: acetylglutamate kinase [Deltaproteobacteria bacterium CG_4_9_14_3_um_filter_63_12]
MNETVVIKIGGDLASDPQQLAALTDDLKALRAAGWRIVVVHGGGPQVTELSARLGLKKNVVAGRRVTDAETLEVTKMVLAGLVAVDLVAAMATRGLDAIGLAAVSAGVIRATKRPPRVVSGGGPAPVDFGFVGDIVEVGVKALNALLDAGLVPVMNSLGRDDAGQVLNINADTAATRVAQALGARLVLTTGGVRGVLSDRNDPTSRIATLTESAAREATRSGVIEGGMIPKIEESLEVLGQGVWAIHIMGALEAGDLLAELNQPGSVGTALVSD